MENNIENIDLINAYLNNTLSKSEKLAFNKRLETDSEFNQLYNEQLAILQGINRVFLKAEINAAKQSYIRTKWMKYIGISIGVILFSAIVYTFSFKTETHQIVEPINNNVIEVISDSIIIEKVSEEKTEPEIVVEQIEVETNSKEKETVKEENEITKSQKSTNNDEVIKNSAITADKNDAVSNRQPETGTIEPISLELKAFFKSVKKAPQVIEVNTEKDFTITCKEGTKLTIPAKAFVDAKTGKLARGKINLEVTEYYKLSDMLLGNLTTKSDDKQLETGGMLYLDANSNGQKLELKERIVVSFPSIEKKEEMQLFNGVKQENTVNWKLESNQLTNIFFPETLSGEEYDKTLYIKEIMLDSNYVVSEEFYNVFKEYEDKKLIRKLGVYHNNQKVIIRKLLLDMENSPFKVQESDSLSRGGHIIRKPLKLYQKQYSRTFQPNSPTTKEDKYNVFGASKLGWINCDRFVKNKKRKIKYKFKIKDANGADVKMVFKSISSILPSKKRYGEYDFGKVPIDEKVKIIAIKESNRKYFIDIIDTETILRPKLEFNFKEVTIEELQIELQKLNSEF